MPAPRLEPDEALAGPLYAVAAILVAMPAVDFLMSVGSPQLASVQWRFATVGLLSGFTLTPILGVALALGVAGLRQHAMVQRVLTVLSLLTAVALFVLLLGFILDMLQLRRQVPAEGLPAFKSASLRAALKHAMSASAFAYLWWNGRRMVPERSRSKPQRPPVTIVTK